MQYGPFKKILNPWNTRCAEVQSILVEITTEPTLYERKIITEIFQYL